MILYSLFRIGGRCPTSPPPALSYTCGMPIRANLLSEGGTGSGRARMIIITGGSAPAGLERTETQAQEGGREGSSIL